MAPPCPPHLQFDGDDDGAQVLGHLPHQHQALQRQAEQSGGGEPGGVTIMCVWEGSQYWGGGGLGGEG